MQIIIQRDGRILLQEHTKEDRFLDHADPYALTMVMRSHTVFEDGLTLRQLMKAIRPWKESFGSAGWMDFDAWFAEIDRTHLTQVVSEKEDEREALSHLEIYSTVNLHRPDEGHLELSSYWDFHAFYQTPVEADGAICKTCSVSFTPARKYANLPICINYKAKVHDRQADYLDGRRPILASEKPGIYTHIETNSSFFDIVVLGLLDKISFHGDPEDTEERGEALSETVATLQSLIEERAAVGEEGSDVSENATSTSDLHSMAVEDFWAEMGLADVGERFEAASELNEAMKEISADDAVLAEKLDITMVGLGELKAGINAHMTTNAIRRVVRVITEHSKKQTS